jgi:hypothetical protein
MGFERPAPTTTLAYNAMKSLYAISRARVQYLSSVVPLFRFKHCLFESLIATVHESDLRPSISDDILEQNQLQFPVEHERILLQKFLEFSAHPVLSTLLQLSI